MHSNLLKKETLIIFFKIKGCAEKHKIKVIKLNGNALSNKQIDNSGYKLYVVGQQES